MSLLFVIQLLIICPFLVLALRYLIKNSLITKTQRLQNGRSAVLAIYFIPVFIQGLLLLYLSIIHFYLFTKDIYFFLFTVFKSGEYDKPDLTYLFAFCFGALLMSITAWLAAVSANMVINAEQVIYKSLYAVSAACMVSIIYKNIPGFIMADTTKPLIFYSEPFVIAAGLAAYVILLFSVFFYRASKGFLKYMQLSVIASLTYIVISFLLALVTFIVVSLLKLLF